MNATTKRDERLSRQLDPPINRVGLKQNLSRNLWLLLDQALVSGCNFTTSAVLARMLGLRAYGVFSIYYVVLQYINSIQLSLTVAPMLSLAPQIKDVKSRNSFFRGVAGLEYTFVVACAIVFLLVAALCNTYFLPTHINSSVAIPYGLTIIFFQLQDWLRRKFYALSDGKSAALNDVISYGGQVLCLLAVWKSGTHSVEAAFYTIGATSVIAFCAGSFYTSIGTNAKETLQALRPSWRLGGRLLLANQFQWLGAQGILVIVAAFIGVESASGIRAVITILGPIYVLYQLMDNVIPVRGAHAFAASGRTGLVRYLWKVSITMGTAVCIALVLISAYGSFILVRVFGTPFGAYSKLVTWQCLYAALGLLYRVLQYYHRTVGSVHVMAKTASIAAMVSVTLCLILTKPFGTVGAMMALVAGQVINVVLPLLWPLDNKKGVL